MRYYVSFKKYMFPMGFLTLLVFSLTALNLILFIIDEGSFKSVADYSQFAGIAFALMMLQGLVKALKKESYIEIDKEQIIYKWGRTKIVYEFKNCDHFTMFPSNRVSSVLIYDNIRKKDIKLSLAVFDVDYDEFVRLLKVYSRKEVFSKGYGEETVKI